MKMIRYKMSIWHSIKDNLKNYADFYITCCIPVISFSFSAHMLFYLSRERAWRTGGFVNCMLLLSGILLTVCLAVFRYSLKAYIRQKSGQYSILLMLGITSRDFWINFMVEYCPTFLLILSSMTVGCSMVCDLVMGLVFGRISAFSRNVCGAGSAVNMDVLVSSAKITFLLILLFVLGMFGSMLLLILRQWRKDLAIFLEEISRGKEVMHRFRIAYGVKIPAAVVCLALSFYLLYDYTVGKMFLAAFLHMAGVYFLLQINGRLLKKLLMFRKKVYFRHLLWWNDLLYECRLNGNIIFAIYGVNFVLVFLFGGMFASDFPEDPVYTVVQVLTGVIGLSVLLEEQAFILEKMILDLQKEKERWDILFQIGMEWETWRRLVQNKLKMIVIIPMAAASVMGAVFFFCDYVYQADVTTFDGMWSAVLLKYTGAVVLFWLLQYGGYLLINRRLLRKYYVWQETLQE